MPLLRKVALLAIAFGLGLTQAWADTVPAIADSQVSFAQLQAKGGALMYLTVKNAPPGGLFQGFVRFDLSAIPPGSLVTKATLRAWVNQFNKPGRVDVLPVFGPWTEANLTAATAPPLGDRVTFINVTSANLRTYVNADVTQLVQDWVSGDLANNGVALAGDPTNDVWVRFDSKESVRGSHAIELELVLGDPVVNGAITDVFAGFGLDGGGTAGEVDLDVNLNEIQARITPCAAGKAIQSVSSGGVPTCVDIGDITEVNTLAGSGLTGGASIGPVNLSVDPNQFQKRVNSSPCAGAGLSVKSIDVNGNVTCAQDVDTNSGGTVTNVMTALGSGLVVSNPSTTPILAVDATIQRRTVAPTCPAGSALREVAQDGTPVCQSLLAGLSVFGTFNVSQSSQGTSSIFMTPVAGSACFLTRVSTADVDSGNAEFAQCRIVQIAGLWRLDASMGPIGVLDDGGEVACSAICLQW